MKRGYGLLRCAVALLTCVSLVAYPCEIHAGPFMQVEVDNVEDFGTDGPEAFDYPDIAGPAAKTVIDGRADRAILLCGTGIGMSITANKIAGVRAALCHDELTAQISRQHNDANVLCLPADLIGEELMRRMVEVWLQTSFVGGRHARRVGKIMDIERENLCAKPEPQSRSSR